MTTPQDFTLGITLMAALVAVAYRIKAKPPDDDTEED